MSEDVPFGPTHEIDFKLAGEPPQEMTVFLMASSGASWKCGALREADGSYRITGPFELVTPANE